MGLQDRDYMKETYTLKSGFTSKPIKPKKSFLVLLVNLFKNFRLSFKLVVLKNFFISLLLLIGFVIVFNILGVVAKSSSLKSALKTSALFPPFQSSPKIIPGGIILAADRQGHFRCTVLINNVPMPFMIDTGATTTVIPAKLAAAIGLPFGLSGISKTAGGPAAYHETHIDSLKIGSAEIRGLDASINPYIEEGLIGMNTLKLFRMTQEVNTLKLVLFNKPEEIAEIERGLTPAVHPEYTASMEPRQVEIVPSVQPIKKSWMKIVLCDDHNRCKTNYFSDHH